MLARLVSLASLATVVMAAPPRTEPIGGYFPEPWVAGVFIGVFGVAAAITWSHYIRNRRDLAVSTEKSSFRSFSLTTTLGLTCMTLGFIVRLYNGISKNLSLGAYIPEQLFILLSPCAFLASAYITFGHLNRSYEPHITRRCLFVSPKRNLSLWFVVCDVISFFTLAIGASMTVSASVMSVGNTIAMVGLAFQCVTFGKSPLYIYRLRKRANARGVLAGLFTLLLAVFAWRLAHEFPEAWNSGDGTTIFSVNPFSKKDIGDRKVIFTTLGVTCVGIMLRCIFRVIEYAGGYRGKLRAKEIYVTVLDFLPLLLVMWLYVWVWPTRALRREAVAKNASYDLGETAEKK